MSEPVPIIRKFNPIRRLIFLISLMAFMCVCMRTLRFTLEGLNLAFIGLFFLLPFFAIKPALRLRSWAKIMTFVLLIPVIGFSVFDLLGMAACDIPDAVNHVPLSEEICTLKQGHYSVRLAREETAGGAIGPHGVSLEQRRTIVPGIFAVKYLDYFEGANEGSISFVGPARVALYIPIAGYYQNQRNVRREYALKPWLYF